MTQLHGVLFDLDNTLINTEKIKQAFIAIALKYGIESEDKAWEIYKEARDKDGKIKMSLNHFLDVLETHVEYVDREKAESEFESTCAKGLRFEGVEELLGELKQRNIQYSVLTLGVPEWQVQKMDAAGLGDYFDEDESILFTENTGAGKEKMLTDQFGEDFDGDGYVLFNDKPDETERLLERFPKLQVYVHNERVDKGYKDDAFAELKDRNPERVVFAKSFSDLGIEFRKRFLSEVYDGVKK